MLHALLSTAVLPQLADDFNMVMDDNVNAFGCMIHFYMIIKMYLIDLIYSELLKSLWLYCLVLPQVCVENRSKNRPKESSMLHIMWDLLISVYD